MEKEYARFPMILVLIALLLCVLVQVAVAKTYYVAPGGADNPSGGTREDPWGKINFGDSLSLLQPGDTVVVMAGTYTHSAAAMGTINKCSGTAEAPITYVANGKVIIDGAGSPSSTHAAVLLGAGIDYIVFDGFEIKGGRRCMNITGTAANPAIGNVIRNCIFHDPWGGYMMQNAHIGDCKIYNNLFYITDGLGTSASRCIITGSILYGNKIWNNTFYINSDNSPDTAQGGIIWNGVSASADPAKMGTDEVRNNIIWPRPGVWGLWSFSATPIYTPPGVDPGTWYGIPFVHSHNLYMPDGLRFQWIFPPVQYADCSLHDAWSVGIPVDHEFYGDPMFVDTDFNLHEMSPAKGAGVDVGLPFNGTAPDLGRLKPYETDTLGLALSKPDGTRVNVATSVATIASGKFKYDEIYVEDESRSSGVKVISADALPTINEGDRVQVSGTLSTVDGERVILGSAAVVSSGTPLKPLGTPGKSLGGGGLDNSGLLVTTWGKVTYVDPESKYFCIDDGSGKNDGLGHDGVPVVVSDLVTPISPLPDPSATPAPYVSVTGLVGKKDLGGGVVAVIQPRASTDIF